MSEAKELLFSMKRDWLTNATKIRKFPMKLAHSKPLVTFPRPLDCREMGSRWEWGGTDTQHWVHRTSDLGREGRAGPGVGDSCRELSKTGGIETQAEEKAEDCDFKPKDPVGLFYEGIHPRVSMPKERNHGEWEGQHVRETGSVTGEWVSEEVNG